MSILIPVLLVVAVVVAGLYFFVPSVHTALLKAYTVARDDLNKLVADGEALVARLEAHAKSQNAAAASHVAAAAASNAAAAAASTNASTAAAAAAALKPVVASIAVAPAVKSA